MPALASEVTTAPLKTGAVLRLLVRNHPGVMSHICGLFARRGFNVDGILCLPVGVGTRSVILLVVNEDERLEQLLRQLRKLEDVLEIQRAPEAREAFAAVAGWLQVEESAGEASRSVRPAPLDC
jgi:acetolactate synthase I/III small subunit